jgi:hypothetical protein
MSITVSCPACSAKLKAPDQAAGHKLKCPGCGERVRVPGQKAAPPGPAAAKPAEVAPPRPKPAAAAPPVAPSRAGRKAPAAAGTRVPEELPATVADSGPWPEADPDVTLVEPIDEPPAKSPAKPLAEETLVEPLDEVHDGSDTVRIAVDDMPADGGGEPAKGPDFHELGFLKRDRLVIRLWSPAFSWGSGYRPKQLRIYDAAEKLADRKAPPVAFGDENVSTLVRLFVKGSNLGIGPIKLRSFFPFRLDVREEQDGPVVFSLRWRVSLVRFYQRIDVCDAAGELVSYFRKKIFTFFGGFRVYDAQDREVAEVKAKFGSPPRVSFVTADGRELGHVTPFGVMEAIETRKSVFINNSSWTENESMGISATFADEIAGDARAKALLVATAMVVEFTGVLSGFARGR